MIKSIAKLLNNRLLLQKQIPRFSTPKDGEEDTPVDSEIVQTQKQQIEATQSQVQAVEGEEAPEALATKEVADTAYVEDDPFEGINLLQSNWNDVAYLINTAYYHNKQDPGLQIQVNQKLEKIEQLYNFNLNDLNRAKVLQQREFDIRSSINAIAWQSNRFLQNDISESSRIGYSMMTGKRFRQLLDTNNIQAIKQLYRNNEFQTFLIQADAGIKIIDMVVQKNYENHFILNLLECLRSVQKDKLLKPTKNFEKIIQNINQLDELNKLKFFWRINSAVENGHEFVRYNIINHELAKIKFEGFDNLISEKALRNAYSAILGNKAMTKLIDYSLQKYSQSFNQFVQFWGLFNLLITRLINLNQSSITHPHNLNSIFYLYELNLDEPKDILTQIIPEVLFETKSKILFEIYRVHAKFWIQRKNDPKLSINVGPFDEFLNQKLDLQQSIQVVYNPWPTENYFPTKSIIRTSKRTSKLPQKTDEILSQTKMIEHLIKGDYSFVLNHFLLVFNPGLEKDSFNDLRKILLQAKEHQFTDQNAKALYILRKINERFFYQSQPVAFRQQFLTDFKKIKWLERKQAEPSKQRKLFVKKTREQDEGKYSRKKVQRDSEEAIDNRQRIYTKAQTKQGALFSKKIKNLFSTQKDSYSEYRQVVKQLSQQATATELSFSSFNNEKFTDLNTFKKQIEERSKQINQVNYKALLSNNNVPIVGSGHSLMKYLFLKKPEGEASKINDQLKRKLKVSFVSQIGALEKDFSQYIEGCRFAFPLAEEVYVALLQDQKTNYVRKSFKTIVSHMIAYKKSLSQTEVQLICDICKKYRIGITLIEIYNLLIENRIKVSKDSIYLFCDSLQKFKKINGDIFLMTKKYCQNINIPFEVNMMGSYIKSLLIQQQDQKLAELCQTLKTELKPRAYKLRSQLSAEQNIKQQKQYKQYQRKQYNRILNQIINVLVMNVNNKLPIFVSELFDEYKKTQTILQSKEIAISLIVYCNDVQKFLSILRQLKNQTDKIVLTTFQCAIKALRLNSRGLEGHSEEIFNTTLFTHNFMLNEDLITKSVQIFKFLTSPTVFIKFLEYILRFNPPLNYEIKNNMYFVMNNINDDFAKNTISGLLDFIFNNNREKQREQYRKAQIAEEVKIKMLQDLEKKEVTIGQTNSQKEKVIEGSEKEKLAEVKQTKKIKSLEKQKGDKRQKEEKKAQNPASAKTEKRRITSKGQQQIVPQGDGILKRSNLKKKLRSKSLTDFQDMFAQKEQIIEDEKNSKDQKTAKPQQKQQKKKGK